MHTADLIKTKTTTKSSEKSQVKAIQGQPFQLRAENRILDPNS